MPTLLVIGATSDIAQAISRIYAEQGYELILAGRRMDDLQMLQKDLQIRYQVNVKMQALDITDVKHHLPFYQSLQPKPDGVVIAVGYLPDQKKAETDWQECENTLLVNYLGPVSLLNIIANDFEQRKKGFIIGISSVAGDRGRQSNYLYGSAKAGFTAYLSGLRGRLHAAGVQVLTVKPGFVRTKLIAHLSTPSVLTAEADMVAKAIIKAQRKNRPVVYMKSIWRWIMCLIVHIPERIFMRLKF